MINNVSSYNTTPTYKEKVTMKSKTKGKSCDTGSKKGSKKPYKKK